MVRCAAKSSTVSPVTLSETVGSRKGVPAIADVAKLVQAADIEIRKQGRDPRVKKAPAEPSELESELLSATHIPFPAWCSACKASRAKEYPHWRNRTEVRMRRRKGTTSCRFTSGFSATVKLGRRLRRTSAWWIMSLSRCSYKVSDLVTKAVVSSVANWGRTDIILMIDGEPSCKSVQGRFRNACSGPTIVQNSPVGSHGWGVERMILEVTGLVRCLGITISSWVRANRYWPGLSDTLPGSDEESTWARSDSSVGHTAR